MRHATTSTAASKSSKKKKDDSDDEDEVMSFLESVGLDKYYDDFVDNGFDSMETIELMTTGAIRISICMSRENLPEEHVPMQPGI